ncbi:hypothetical protein HPB47_007013 [Ixodes persulcatus]|uniref:Uncharacterized protein n=1 Tax=Ixodes persulcatus TaxID=34615 RepID=A0AC60P929_IXOPE|nr:hypothetical protein HPB47_007013 [Ixodes persulcatus]
MGARPATPRLVRKDAPPSVRRVVPCIQAHEKRGNASEDSFFSPGPSHGIGGFVSASGHSPRNFGANVGIRGEYDVHRFRNGGKVTVYGEGSQSFGQANGQSFRGKPQGEVGIRMTIPLGP